MAEPYTPARGEKLDALDSEGFWYSATVQELRLRLKIKPYEYRMSNIRAKGGTGSDQLHGSPCSLSILFMIGFYCPPISKTYDNALKHQRIRIQSTQFTPKHTA